MCFKCVKYLNISLRFIISPHLQGYLTRNYLVQDDLQIKVVIFHILFGAHMNILFVSKVKCIILFRSIIVLCGIDNIPWNIINPTWHCYGSKWCNVRWEYCFLITNNNMYCQLKSDGWIASCALQVACMIHPIVVGGWVRTKNEPQQDMCSKEIGVCAQSLRLL